MMLWRTVMVAFLVAATMAGCGGDRLETLRLTLGGEEALGISRAGTEVQAVVVFFHGLDRDQSILETDDAHRELTATLADAGYAVVASNAGGNAFGNALSQNHYEQLIFGATEHYRTQRVFFLAESMGTLAAVNLMTTVDALGLAAINPLLNTDSLTTSYRALATGANPELGDVNPLAMTPDSLSRKNFRIYVTPDDQLVRTSSNATAFETRFGSVANISVVTCTGEHMDPSCIQGKDIVQWFDSL